MNPLCSGCRALLIGSFFCLASLASSDAQSDDTALAEALDTTATVTASFWQAQTDASLDGDAARADWTGTPIAPSLSLALGFGAPVRKCYVSWRVVSQATGASLSAPGTSLAADPTGDTGWRESVFNVVSSGNATIRANLSGGPATYYVDQVWLTTDPRPRVQGNQRLTVANGTPLSETFTVASTTEATVEAIDLPEGFAFDPATLQLTGSSITPGLRILKLKATNPAGSHVMEVRLTVEPPAVTLAEALDLGTTPVSGNASGKWKGFTGDAHAGGDYAQLAADAAETDTIEIAFEGPGKVTFWNKSEGAATAANSILASVSRKSLSVGGTVISSITAPSDVAWAKSELTLPPGPCFVTLAPKVVPTTGPANPALPVLVDDVSFTSTPELHPGTIGEWKTYWGYAANAMSDDPDNDGLSLLMEYAMGGDPLHNDIDLLPQFSVEDGYGTLRFRKSEYPTDLLYIVQGTRDLKPNGWTSSSVEVLDEDASQLLARCKKPVTLEPTCQMRVRMVLLLP